MGHKIFVSYKYADSTVKSIGEVWDKTTVRDYVDLFESQVRYRGSSIYKGEDNNEDLSSYSENYIWSRLKDRIYDSTVTVLFISPNMKENYRQDRAQWIPWEIAYSVREETRSDHTSHANAIVAVILPDRYGQYSYYFTMDHFHIVKANIDNGYIEVVKWSDFKCDTTRYIESAIRKKEKTPTYKIVKTV